MGENGRLRVRVRRIGACLTLATTGAMALAAGAAASPYVHAHRGGSLQIDASGQQAPAYPENTMPAFRAAAADGFVLEFDVKLTADGVPVVMHDATLDRTTDCSGLVASKTAAELASCQVDILGTDGNFIALPSGDSRRAPIPTMAEVLDLARSTGAGVNLEIKNTPTDPDFDATDAFAQTVVSAIIASGLPPSQLIVQSFWPLNLDVAESRIPTAETSLLTLADPPAPFNEFGPAFAAARGYEWISPQWPIDPAAATTAAYIAEAHALGLRIIPYTLDAPAAVKAAAKAGVDAVISNDPHMARTAIAQVAPAPAPIPSPPSDAACAASQASRTTPPIQAYDAKAGAPRVFAMQPKQELRHVRTYATFRTKIECMIREYVVPRLAKNRPNVVAFNEDIGLMTIATGTRGAAARALFADPSLAPSCEPQGVPCGTLAGLAAVRAGYSRELAAYQARFPDMAPIGASFVAPTDTFARGWMQVFSDMAKRYGVYILGSNNQAPFRESVDPSEIALFADPDQPTPSSVYVATRGTPFNEVFMWGPTDVRKEGPPMLRNVVAQNKKVPLTDIENTLQIAPGPSTGPDAIENLRPYALPGTAARIGFATSLPAFVYGYDFGAQPPPLDPCSDTARYYMACLDRLGTNVVMQDEANPGRWATAAQSGGWQPLEWMSSSWRAVADPTVHFAYNVTPFMVGNLADLVFDGQTSITQRGPASGKGCHYIGNAALGAGDPQAYAPYAGPKREFIAIAPWVTADGPRDALSATGAKLAPGSRDPLENDYVETAAIADLPFPVDTARKSCVAPAKRLVGGGGGGGLLP